MLNEQHNHKIQTTLDGSKLIEDWDFARADTSYLTHGIHDYPARMIPQIAERLIKRYSKENTHVLDPFCGSGTTLVEAKLARRNSTGNDINPLALLLAKVKSMPIDFTKSKFDLPIFLKNLEEDFVDSKKFEKLPEPPLAIMPNLLHWFKQEAARELEFLYQHIIKMKNKDVKEFLLIVFSHTVFKSSNIDHRSSRFIRVLHEHELKKFKPNVFQNFRNKIIETTTIMNDFMNIVGPKNLAKVNVNKGDARKLPFEEDTFDSIVTSPPYGEEKNTVGYTRWSKLSVAWLRLNGKEIESSEKMSLGALHHNDMKSTLKTLQSDTAKSLFSNLLKSNEKRVIDALPFFVDYRDSLLEMYRVLKPTSFCCIVIGDRMISKIPLNMEKVTVELARSVGFRHESSFFRKLPMKMIPWDTPTGKTISRESIIILKKR